MTSLVFGVRPSSPLVYLGVCVLLAFVATVAAILPAMRASSLDPLTALRAE
jgi:ABC-type lipoprotein release transport system permease subunit